MKSHLQKLKEHWKAKADRKQKKGCVKRKPLSYATRQKKKSRPVTGELRKSAKPKTRTPIRKGNRNAYRNQKFYELVWSSKPHYCEECLLLNPGKPDLAWLGDKLYAVFISHITAKGANTFLRDDPRNANILCPSHHAQWEFGDKKSMKIYPQNLLIIEQLKAEFYQRK